MVAWGLNSGPHAYRQTLCWLSVSPASHYSFDRFSLVLGSIPDGSIILHLTRMHKTSHAHSLPLVSSCQSSSAFLRWWPHCLGIAPHTESVPGTSPWCITASLSLSSCHCCWGWTHEKGPSLWLGIVMGTYVTCWVPCSHQVLRKSRCLFKVCKERAEEGPLQVSRQSSSSWTLQTFASVDKLATGSLSLGPLQLWSVLGQPGLFTSSSPPTPWHYVKYSLDVSQFNQ